MMRDPPGDPRVSTSLPSASNTRVGDWLERGRLPGAARLITGRPSSRARKEKSVSSLFNMKPLTMSREPKAPPIELVIATALPLASMTPIWVVEGASPSSTGPIPQAPRRATVPGLALPMARAREIRAERLAI